MSAINRQGWTLGQIAWLSLLLLGSTNDANAQKTDIVQLKNGDRITVEVKELVRGQMRLKTDAFGTIYVKWEDVDHIETEKRLQVELSDGRRYFGSAKPSELSGKLALDVRGEVVTLTRNEIVSIQPIKGSGSLRGSLDNSLAAGFSYTQANSVMRWNVAASSKYRTEKYLVSASFDSIVTNNGSGKDSKRRDIGGQYSRYLRDRWFWFANSQFQENDELGIDGRLLVGGGFGRYLFESQNQELLLGAGLTANLENALGSSDPNDSDSDRDTSLEGHLSGEWSFFRLHSPKSDVSIRASLFPGITESDRLRGDVRVRYRQEFFTDLFLNLTYYYNFDTDPPAGALSETDYGIVTSLELEF